MKLTSIKLHIENMTCGGCARGVTKAIQSVDPQAIVTTDPASRSVEVDSSVDQERIESALREAGFPARAS